MELYNYHYENEQLLSIEPADQKRKLAISDHILKMVFAAEEQYKHDSEVFKTIKIYREILRSIPNPLELTLIASSIKRSLKNSEWAKDILLIALNRTYTIDERVQIFDYLRSNCGATEISFGGDFEIDSMETAEVLIIYIFKQL